MKKLYAKLAILALLATSAASAQTTVAAWNFNGTSDTTVPGDSFSPMASTAITNASAHLIGGTTAIFNTGNTSAGTQETETTTPPNYAWHTTTYPALGTANKTAGVEFEVSTVGYGGITFRFEQRLSNKAGNTYWVQYTTNASVATPVWVDAQMFTFTPAATGTGDTWYSDRTVDLSAVTALNNNANAGFRIVAAFDPTTNDYLAARSTSAYDGTGTVRFDMVKVIASTTLGTQEFSRNTFAMSPNPSNHAIVQLDKTYDVTVYDLLGKPVFNAKQASEIDTRNFATGVYVVKTDAGISKKLIVE